MNRTPPANTNAERSILSAFLLDNRAADRYLDELEPDLFSLEAHQAVYRCIYAMRQKGAVVDFVTLTEALHRDGTLEKIGGAPFVSELMDFSGTSAGLQQYIEIVQQCAGRRRIIEAGLRLVEHAYDQKSNDLDMLIEEAAALPNAVHRADTKGSYIASVGQDVLAEEERRRSQGLTGTAKTGLSPLDDHVNVPLGGGPGFGELTLVTGWTSGGKTTLTLNATANFVRLNDEPALYIGSEDTLDNTVLWLHRSEFRRRWQYSKEPTEEDFVAARYAIQGDMAKMPLMIENLRGAPIERVAGTIRECHARTGCRFFVIDRLRKFRLPKARREYEEIDAAMDIIGNVCVRLNVLVIVVAQLRRVERQDDFRPRRTDLKGSSGLEQDSRIIIATHNPQQVALDAAASYRERARYASSKDRTKFEERSDRLIREADHLKDEMYVGILKQKHGPEMWTYSEEGSDGRTVQRHLKLKWYKPWYLIRDERKTHAHQSSLL